ncbi:MAG: DUF1611 domain-containing protein [Sediminibacterium sp.]|nr:DUF1611 domain-containing protein [Sediminibacterium sp.]
MISLHLHLNKDHKPFELAQLYCSFFSDGLILHHINYNNDWQFVHFYAGGIHWLADNMNPMPKAEPPISFFCFYITAEESQKLWSKLSDSGTLVMPLNSYPWSNCYGWLKDKYGYQWQICTDPNEPLVNKIIPAIHWCGNYFGKAQSALNFYTNLFANSNIVGVTNYDKMDPIPETYIKHARFTIEHQNFIALESPQGLINEHSEPAINITYFVNELSFNGNIINTLSSGNHPAFITDKFGINWKFWSANIQDFFHIITSLSYKNILFNQWLHKAEIKFSDVEQVLTKKPTALLLSGGFFSAMEAKTTHGLVRFSKRFSIKGVIDNEENSGKDAGELLDGKPRQIFMYASIEQALAANAKIDFLIVGIATVGGKLPPHLLNIIKTAIEHKISIINGLHDFLQENENIVALAQKNQIELIDVRFPKKRKELNFWKGQINSIPIPIIAVLGTDCALGKRTSATMAAEHFKHNGYSAEMIFTGQTGWLQGGKYGFIFDSTVNDFISGEIEHAICKCYHLEKPQFIFIEGQSALRNPSGPCGSEFLVSGNAKFVILVYSPKRIYYDDDPLWGKLPSLTSEIQLISNYGSKVIAIFMNTKNCSKEEKIYLKKQTQTETSLPVILPLEEGLEELTSIFKNHQLI